MDVYVWHRLRGRCAAYDIAGKWIEYIKDVLTGAILPEVNTRFHVMCRWVVLDELIFLDSRKLDGLDP